MSEEDLETEISATNNDMARYVVGKLLLEGTSDKIKKNQKKGINWIKEAIKNGNMQAKEFKAYYDIRFDK